MCGRLRRADKSATIGDMINVIKSSGGNQITRWGGEDGDYAFARIETLRKGGWKGYRTGHVFVDQIQEHGAWSESQRVAIAFIYRGQHSALVTRSATPEEVAQFGHRRLPLVVTEQPDGSWKPDKTHRWRADVKQIQMAIKTALEEAQRGSE